MRTVVVTANARNPLKAKCLAHVDKDGVVKYYKMRASGPLLDGEVKLDVIASDQEIRDVYHNKIKKGLL